MMAFPTSVQKLTAHSLRLAPTAERYDLVGPAIQGRFLLFKRSSDRLRSFPAVRLLGDEFLSVDIALQLIELRH